MEKRRMGAMVGVPLGVCLQGLPAAAQEVGWRYRRLDMDVAIDPATATASGIPST